MPLDTNPICVAIDTDDTARACNLAATLKNHVGMVKIGMEFFYKNGITGYQTIAELGVPVFLDLKLHDIPNTVAGGLNSLMQLSPRPAIVNVHATGGPAMLKAASKAIDGRTKLIAVTILTSLDNDDLVYAGFDGAKNTRDHAVSLAKLSQASGLDGVVCSPNDLEGIRTSCKPDFLTVVPGIRPQGADVQDQKRVATPKIAIGAGADILVIGRAITNSTDPAGAAELILESLS